MPIEILMIPIIFILVTIYSFFKNKIIFWFNIIFIVISVTATIISYASLKEKDKGAYYLGTPSLLLSLLGFIILPIIELLIIQFSFAWRQKQTGNLNANRSRNKNLNINV
jgi:hypothetical protein